MNWEYEFLRMFFIMCIAYICENFLIGFLPESASTWHWASGYVSAYIIFRCWKRIP